MTNIKIIILFIFLIQALSIHVTHLQYYTNTSQTIWQFLSFTQMLGIIIVVAAFGFLCYKFRGCMDCFYRNQNESQPVVNTNSNNNSGTRYEQPNRYAPVTNEQSRGTNKQNTMYEQFQKQYNKNGTQKTNAYSLVESSNPYETKKQNKWSYNYQFDKPKRASTTCGICRIFKNGSQIPIVVVDCGEDDIFHLSCLSKHRKTRVQQFQSNGLNKCPSCKDTYSTSVRIFCSKCRKRCFSINVSQYSLNNGEISTSKLLQMYSPYCQNFVKQSMINQPTIIGLMDSAYFVSKNELLIWINNTLNLQLIYIQDLGSGSIYCQLIDAYSKNIVPMNRINWRAKFQYQYVANLKIFQQILEKLKTGRKIDVNKLSKIKYQDNLQTIQWLKRYLQMTFKLQNNYDPEARRNRQTFISPTLQKSTFQNKSKILSPRASFNNTIRKQISKQNNIQNKDVKIQKIKHILSNEQSNDSKISSIRDVVYDSKIILAQIQGNCQRMEQEIF